MRKADPIYLLKRVVERAERAKSLEEVVKSTKRTIEYLEEEIKQGRIESYETD